MNGDSDLDFVDFDEVEPNFLSDGLGVRGQQTFSPEDDSSEWPVEVQFYDVKDVDDDSTAGGCDPGPPPDSGTWVFGSVDGTCQWIDTTTCS
jgi:hypothetical protein